jgi:carbon storage regulator CsrA
MVFTSDVISQCAGGSRCAMQIVTQRFCSWVWEQPEREGALMLILTRKKREQIVIGQDIEIIVLSISGNRVKLGIKAADDVSAWRKELEHRCGRSLPGKPR